MAQQTRQTTTHGGSDVQTTQALREQKQAQTGKQISQNTGSQESSGTRRSDSESSQVAIGSQKSTQESSDVSSSRAIGLQRSKAEQKSREEAIQEVGGSITRATNSGGKQASFEDIGSTLTFTLNLVL